MPIGLPVAITLLAQTASTATPPVPAPTAVAPPAKSSDDGCKDKANPDTREIVICAQKPQGYRLNPDVMLAKRAIRSGGRPTRPGPGGHHAERIPALPRVQARARGEGSREEGESGGKGQSGQRRYAGESANREVNFLS